MHENMVQYNRILNEIMQWLRMDLDHTLLSQQETVHKLSSQVSYGVSTVSFCDKIDQL